MIAAFALALLLAAPSDESATAVVDDAKALYREARFSEAVVKLDSAIAAMRSADREQARAVLAEAYLHLGLAHLALSDRTAAFAAFKELARLDPERQLDADIYAPKVRRLFEEARAEARREATPPPAGATAPPTPPMLPPRAGLSPLWIAGAAAAAGGVAVVATQTGGEGTPSIVPSLTLNGTTAGGSHSCAAGLIFRVGASNPTSRAVRVTRFNLTLQSSTPPCISHSAPVFGDGLESAQLPPRASDVQLRRMDLAGDLCKPPNGSADGCLWQANLVLETDVGNFGRDLQFSTVP
jgi:hypothetical protein